MPTIDSNPTIPNRRVLDKQFISEIVSAPVKEFKISAGSNPGDGVAGNLLAINIKTVSDEVHNIVLKSALPMTGEIDKETLANSELISGITVFPTEILYYKDFAPMLQKVPDKHSRILPVFAQPKYYAGYSNRENGLNDYIAMEDLRPSGYKMADKFKGLSLEEMKWAMRGLATFHSVSYVLLNGSNANQAFCDMQNDADLNKHGWDNFFNPLYNGLIRKMVELVKEMGHEDAGTRMEKLVESGYQRLRDLFKKTGTDDKYFTVLVHTDLWTNNIMFKYASDGKSVEDVKFIDFQQMRFGNIYEDLIYFIFTSTTPEFRRNYLETIMKIYFDEFHMVLKESGCLIPNGFTIGTLNQTFREQWTHGSCYNLVTIPFQLGINPPAPSEDDKVTEKNGNDTNNSSNGNKKSEQKTQAETLNDMVVDYEEALTAATRNSPVAKKWLLEVIEEMKEHGVI